VVILHGNLSSEVLDNMDFVVCAFFHKLIFGGLVFVEAILCS